MGKTKKSFVTWKNVEVEVLEISGVFA